METKLLGPVELGEKLGLSDKTIYRVASQEPERLPRRIKLPGSSALRWHPQVVDNWLANLAGLNSVTPVTNILQKKRRPGRPTNGERLARIAEQGVRHD